MDEVLEVLEPEPGILVVALTLGRVRCGFGVAPWESLRTMRCSRSRRRTLTRRKRSNRKGLITMGKTTGGPTGLGAGGAGKRTGLGILTAEARSGVASGVGITRGLAMLSLRSAAARLHGRSVAVVVWVADPIGASMARVSVVEVLAQIGASMDEHEEFLLEEHEVILVNKVEGMVALRNGSLCHPQLRGLTGMETPLQGKSARWGMVAPREQ